MPPGILIIIKNNNPIPPAGLCWLLHLFGKQVNPPWEELDDTSSSKALTQIKGKPEGSS